MKEPTNLLSLLISLFAEQEGINITYEFEKEGN